MFFLLRKICIGIALLAVALGIYYLYLKREIFRPIVAMVEVWRNENIYQQRITGSASGKVVQVVNGNTFWVKMANGKQFPMQLTGIDVPVLPPKPEPELKDLILKSRELLTDLILSNDISWQITYTNYQTNVAGVVSVGTNNVNLSLLKSGLAKLHKPAIAGLPRQDQYHFIQAEYIARKEKKGWWGSAYADYY